jgi:hypothetical protein
LADGMFVDGDWVESKDQDPGGDGRLVQLADVGDGAYRDRSARYLVYFARRDHLSRGRDHAVRWS